MTETGRSQPELGLHLQPGIQPTGAQTINNKAQNVPLRRQVGGRHLHPRLLTPEATDHFPMGSPCDGQSIRKQSEMATALGVGWGGCLEMRQSLLLQKIPTPLSML